MTSGMRSTLIYGVDRGWVAKQRVLSRDRAPKAHASLESPRLEGMKSCSTLDSCTETATWPGRGSPIFNLGAMYDVGLAQWPKVVQLVKRICSCNI